ncbi:FAD-linked oxidase [Longispora fulva]|uniref:FAD/FMN-containing dehydrogenase n=1 Tax=Longispora fulva TaxID=619741 RepID=A0A8J7GCY9_9ACTN|nr:FAD-binding oxidoreductase [Longispora fulva]MBG6138273.1 FAD/FMN-containing dehydrogenase [Longispora fulva]GIG60525.1 FAD-linked oxidase [Longispora fulva]
MTTILPSATLSPVTPAFVAALRRSFAGELFEPGDDGYEQARLIWNGAITRRPGLIARCSGTADVLATVRAAREHGILTAIRGGGHNVAGNALCEGGVVLDLSALRGVRVDPVARLARVQAGVLIGALDRETQAFGLACPAGIVTETGVAGLTLGGGIGWLMRKWGLTCDNLRSADVVTADGQAVTASRADHDELFWALRGGGGNFGVVTSFEFDAHPLGPQVLAGLVLYPAERAEQVLRAYRDHLTDAPDELCTGLSLRIAPVAPYLPASVHGRPVVGVPVLYAGPPAAGERVVAPMRALAGPPLVDLVGPTTFAVHQSLFDRSVPAGLGYHWKSHYLPPLTDAAIATLVEWAWRLPCASCYTILFHLGGAVARPDPADAAFEDRTAEHALNVNAVWQPGEDPDPHIEWARELWSAMAPHATGGVYVNFLGSEGEERVRAAYGPGKLARLAAVKARYDPTNFFRVNQNIAPGAP